MVAMMALAVWTAGCDSHGTHAADAGGGGDRPAGHAPGTRVEGLPAPEAGSTTLDGLFMVVRFSGSSISQFYYFFTPGGYVYLGIPRGGLKHFDFEEAVKNEPKLTGTYTIRDDKITITFADGSTRQIDFARKDEGKISLEGLHAHRAAPFKAGTTFDGEYVGGAASRVGGSFAASAQTYAFKPDGTYRHSGVGSIAASSDRTEVAGGSASTQTGTYAVSGNTLELKHADGTTTRHTIFPYEDYDKNIQLNIDGAMFKPQ